MPRPARLKAQTATVGYAILQLTAPIQTLVLAAKTSHCLTACAMHLSFCWWSNSAMLQRLFYPGLVDATGCKGRKAAGGRRFSMAKMLL